MMQASPWWCKFQVECLSAFGETVKVVGSCPSLGDWNPLQAVTLHTNKSHYPKWTSKLLPLETTEKLIEYKYICVNRHGQLIWESMPYNRRIEIPLPGAQQVTTTKGEWFVTLGEKYNVLPANTVTRVAKSTMVSADITCDDEGKFDKLLNKSGSQTTDTFYSYDDVDSQSAVVTEIIRRQRLEPKSSQTTACSESAGEINLRSNNELLGKYGIFQVEREASDNDCYFSPALCCSAYDHDVSTPAVYVGADHTLSQSTLSTLNDSRLQNVKLPTLRGESTDTHAFESFSLNSRQQNNRARCDVEKTFDAQGALLKSNVNALDGSLTKPLLLSKLRLTDLNNNIEDCTFGEPLPTSFRQFKRRAEELVNCERTVQHTFVTKHHLSHRICKSSARDSAKISFRNADNGRQTENRSLKPSSCSSTIKNRRQLLPVKIRHAKEKLRHLFVLLSQIETATCGYFHLMKTPRGLQAFRGRGDGCSKGPLSATQGRPSCPEISGASGAVGGTSYCQKLCFAASWAVFFVTLSMILIFVPLFLQLRFLFPDRVPPCFSFEGCVVILHATVRNMLNDLASSARKIIEPLGIYGLLNVRK